MIERQELHCHHCDRYVQFDIDLSMDGNHILRCPNCDHQHFRVVRNGRITGERWGRDPSQDMPNIYVSTTTVTYSTSTVSDYYTYQAWSNTTATY